jgi:SGNH domain (fused to AT3 domains)
MWGRRTRSIGLIEIHGSISKSSAECQEQLSNFRVRCENLIMISRLVVVLLTGALFFSGAAHADSSIVDSVPVPAYEFPALTDGPVPDSLRAALGTVATDRPKPYKDRCHVQQNLTSTSSSCIYGNRASKTTVVLFGDSHALSWFPAIEKLAIAKKWRLLSLTMSSCWPANIPAWNASTNLLMTNCAIWRHNALAQIAKAKPYLTFVSGTRGFATIDEIGNVLSGDARTSAWLEGMTETLNSIKNASKNTIFISDTPYSTSKFPDCLMESLDSYENCSTPVSKAISTDWLTVERDLAVSVDVTWVNPTEWVCNTDPCSPIAGNTLIYRDGGHLTATFALQLEKPLWAEISGQLI